jgi:hypothetical protein
MGARAVFEWLFREYGLPRVIRADNGAPFATGCSRLPGTTSSHPRDSIRLSWRSLVQRAIHQPPNPAALGLFL